MYILTYINIHFKKNKKKLKLMCGCKLEELIILSKLKTFNYVFILFNVLMLKIKSKILF